MRKTLLVGMAAGAVGTVALDVSTYLDMVVRARPSSGMPAETAGAVAERAGVDLGGDGESAERASNRKSGLGALFGYGVGIGLGTLYGLLRPAVRRLPRPAAGVGLGLAAMAASDVPPTVLGITDPRSWDRSSWASDLIPHLAYGLATALTFDALATERR
ncbi:MAG TPA: hypothetical protein VE664_07785 [Actinomycetes bacterium]|nr:hypothetical protein [Actinomycetes bacterium]